MSNIGDTRIMAEWVDFVPMDEKNHPNWLAANFLIDGPFGTEEEAAKVANKKDVHGEGRVIIQKYVEMPDGSLAWDMVMNLDAKSYL